MPINSFLYPGASGPVVYEVANSLRFEDGNSDTLSRTPSSSGNRKTWTWSGWIKRSELGRTQNFFSAGTNNQNYGRIQFNSNDSIYIAHVDSASTTTEKQTTQVFRDISSWYHIVWHIDTTQSTASNREKLYVNGAQITDFSTNTIPAEDYQSTINEDVAHYIGTQLASYEKCSCYFSEVAFIDGQALTPTSFGEFDSDSPNIWKPISVSGLTFGTNGFYLEFEQSGTSQNSSGLGADTSGNDNHFAVSNLTAVDQSTDTCTNNFATMNPLAIDVSKSYTFSEGNLNISLPENAPSLATIGVSSGKWYAEVKFINNTGWHGVAPIDSAISSNTGVIQWYQGNTLYVSGSNTATWGSALSNNDIMGIALDMDNSRVTISQNGNWWGGSSYNQSAPHTYYSLVSGYDDTITFYGNSGNGTSSVSFNFGSPSFSISSGNSDANGYGNFEYSVPSGYYALNTKNLAEFG